MFLRIIYIKELFISFKNHENNHIENFSILYTVFRCVCSFLIFKKLLLI